MIERSGCKRFRRLCEDREDRDLKPRESRFMDAHRQACTPCRREEFASATSLNMLRSVALEAEAPASFDARLVRMIRIEQSRERFAYWFPAIVGAGIASFGIFALMQLVTASHTAKPFLIPSAASNVAPQAHPEPRLLLPPAQRG